MNPVYVIEWKKETGPVYFQGKHAKYKQPLFSRFITAAIHFGNHPEAERMLDIWRRKAWVHGHAPERLNLKEV